METMSYSSVNDMERINLVVVGDPGIGKRSMLHTYFENKFPEQKFSYMFEHIHEARIKIENNEKIYELKAWDCGTGSECYW